MKKATGGFIDASAGRVTIAALGEEWLAGRAHIKPSTRRVDESAWRTHVEPRWGKRGVGTVRHSEVQTWIAEISALRGATTVKRAHGILASILDVAERDRRIPSNPARGVRLPRKIGKSRAYLTHAQVEALAAESGTHGIIVLFLAYTGLRWGEMSALRVGDLDALNRRVRVERNAVDVGGQIIVGTPKTHASRTVAYPRFLSLPLAALCEGKFREQLLFGDGVDFTRLPHSVTGWFVGAVRRVQKRDADFIRVTPHDLRHTAASLAISSGANVKVVQRMLGHASAAMTLDTYGDLFESDMDDVADRLDQVRNAGRVAI